MTSVFRKISVYVLCLAQVFYSAAFAGVGLSNQAEEGVNPLPTRSVVLTKDMARSSYILSLSTRNDDSLKTLHFVDEKLNPLGRLINHENKSHLIWEGAALELDISGINSSQDSLFVKAGGKLNILNETFSCPTVIEAESLFSSRDLRALSALVMIAKKAKFKNIMGQNILALHVDALVNRGPHVWSCPQLIISCGKGVNSGTLAGEEIRLVGAWKNYNLIDGSIVRISGPAYSTHASSVLKASTGLFMHADQYSEQGTIEALYQSLAVNKAYYIRDLEKEGSYPSIHSEYMDLESGELEVSSQARFHLTKGARFQTKEPLNLKGQFFLGERKEESHLLEGTLEKLLQHDQRWAHPILELRNLSSVTLTPSFYAHLKETGNIRIKTKNSIVEGKIEGAGNSAVNIHAMARTVIDSEQLPPILRVKSNEVSLSSLPPYLERLKVISKNAYVGENVSTHIHSLEAPQSFLTSVAGSHLTIDQAQVEEVSLFGQFKLTNTFESSGKAYFEDLEGMTDHSTVTSEGDFFANQLQGSLKAESAAGVTILAGEMDHLKVESGQDAYIKDVSSTKIEVDGKHILVDGARSAHTDIQGEHVLLVGEIGGTNSKTNVTSTGYIASNADFKGDVSLSSETITSHTGSFESDTRAELKAKVVGAIGRGSPKSLSVEAKYGQGILGEVLKSGSSVNPTEFSLKTEEKIDLSGQAHNFPSQKTTLESTMGIDASKSNLTAQELNLDAPLLDLSKSHLKANDVSVAAKNLTSEESTIEVSGTYSRDIQQDLKASKEYVQALVNTIKVGGNADLSHSTQDATKQIIEVEGELDVSGARLYSHDTSGNIMKPQLVVLSGSLTGKASKVSKGSWSYLYEELDRQPELMCEGGPNVIVAKNGFWLEAPRMKGETLVWGSTQGDAKITPLTLTAIRRWTETHKSKNWCGQVSRSTSTHQHKTQSLVQPQIGTEKDMITTAKEGKVTLLSPQIYVGGNWEIYVKEFGIEAATVLHHYYRHTTSKKAGLMGGTKSSHTLREDREEVVPPVLKVGGNMYVYCEKAHIDSAQMYVEGVLQNHCPDLSFGAQTSHQHVEEHSKQKSFGGTGKSGYTRDRKEQVPGHVDVGGIHSEDPIRFVGSAANVTSRNPEVPTDIRFEAPFTHETFSQYASFDANYLNMGVSAVVGLAATFATGGVGSGMTLTLTEAAFACAASTYATSFLGTGGDPVAAFKNVISEEGLRSIGVAMVTAGITHQMGWQVPRKDALTGYSPSLGERLIGEARRSTVRAAADMTIGGRSGEEALKSGLIHTAANTAGGHFAGMIGEHRADLGYVGHKVLHAAAGAVAGAVLNPDDAARGAMSGAVGAMTAEVMAESLEDSGFDLETISFLSKAGTILAGSSIGLDPAVAQSTATTALENNFMVTALRGALALPAMVLTAQQAETVWQKLKDILGDLPDLPHDMLSSLMVPQGLYDQLMGGGERPPAPGFAPAPEDLRKPTVFTTPPHDQGPQILFTPIDTPQGPKVFVTPMWDGPLPILTTPAEGPKLTTIFYSKPTDLPEGFRWDVKTPKEATKVGESGFWKIYKDPTQKIGNKEIWWSKDRAKHGGSEYKLFVEGKKYFECVGETDATGKILNKNKGPIGEKIPTKDINWKRGK